METPPKIHCEVTLQIGNLANMWPIWGQQDPGGHHVGPINFIIWIRLSWRHLNSTGVNAEWESAYLKIESGPCFNTKTIFSAGGISIKR